MLIKTFKPNRYCVQIRYNFSLCPVAQDFFSVGLLFTLPASVFNDLKKINMQFRTWHCLWDSSIIYANMKICEVGACTALSCILLGSWPNWLLESTPCVGQGGDSVCTLLWKTQIFDYRLARKILRANCSKSCLSNVWVKRKFEKYEGSKKDSHLSVYEGICSMFYCFMTMIILWDL